MGCGSSSDSENKAAQDNRAASSSPDFSRGQPADPPVSSSDADSVVESAFNSPGLFAAPRTRGSDASDDSDDDSIGELAGDLDFEKSSNSGELGRNPQATHRRPRRKAFDETLRHQRARDEACRRYEAEQQKQLGLEEAENQEPNTTSTTVTLASTEAAGTPRKRRQRRTSYHSKDDFTDRPKNADSAPLAGYAGRTNSLDTGNQAASDTLPRGKRSVGTGWLPAIFENGAEQTQKQQSRIVDQQQLQRQRRTTVHATQTSTASSATSAKPKSQPLRERRQSEGTEAEATKLTGSRKRRWSISLADLFCRSCWLFTAPSKSSSASQDSQTSPRKRRESCPAETDSSKLRPQVQVTGPTPRASPIPH